MCEFCVRHGDGQKWYLRAENYAEELLHDARRAKYIEDFIPEVSAKAGRWLRVLDRANRVSPGLSRRASRLTSRRLQAIHFGQVLPLEDVAAILAITAQVVRLPCVCRTVLEKKERAVCYLISASPDALGLRTLLGSREEAAPFVAGMEGVSPGAALAQMTALEDEGAIHTVWTFITPFIGAICNCDPAGCLAVNFTRRGLPLYFPGEEKAAVDAARCTGCGSCVEICQFSALSLGAGPCAAVDVARCHGCGICRRRCPEGALSLTAGTGASAA
jgi:NAD-dependent dihydropyrimidine dehydrogenase PreA subunit